MSVEKYGRKLKGLRKASGDTFPISGGFGWSYQICYDIVADEVWSSLLGANEYLEFKSRDFISVGLVSARHITMQEIADMVNSRIAELKRLKPIWLPPLSDEALEILFGAEKAEKIRRLMEEI